MVTRNNAAPFVPRMSPPAANVYTWWEGEATTAKEVEYMRVIKVQGYHRQPGKFFVARDGEVLGVRNTAAPTG